MYWQEVMRYNVHSMLHAASYSLHRLHADCCHSAVCDLQTVCHMLLFVFLPVYRVCILRAAGCLPVVMPLHAAICGLYAKILPLTSRMYVVSCVQSTVLRARLAACYLP